MPKDKSPKKREPPHATVKKGSRQSNSHSKSARKAVYKTNEPVMTPPTKKPTVFQKLLNRLRKTAAKMDRPKRSSDPMADLDTKVSKPAKLLSVPAFTKQESQKETLKIDEKGESSKHSSHHKSKYSAHKVLSKIVAQERQFSKQKSSKTKENSNQNRTTTTNSKDSHKHRSSSKKKQEPNGSKLQCWQKSQIPFKNKDGPTFQNATIAGKKKAPTSSGDKKQTTDKSATKKRAKRSNKLSVAKSTSSWCDPRSQSLRNYTKSHEKQPGSRMEPSTLPCPNAALPVTPTKRTPMLSILHAGSTSCPEFCSATIREVELQGKSSVVKAKKPVIPHLPVFVRKPENPQRLNLPSKLNLLTPMKVQQRQSQKLAWLSGSNKISKQRKSSSSLPTPSPDNMSVRDRKSPLVLEYTNCIQIVKPRISHSSPPQLLLTTNQNGLIPGAQNRQNKHISSKSSQQQLERELRDKHRIGVPELRKRITLAPPARKTSPIQQKPRASEPSISNEMLEDSDEPGIVDLDLDCMENYRELIDILGESESINRDPAHRKQLDTLRNYLDRGRADITKLKCCMADLCADVHLTLPLVVAIIDQLLQLDIIDDQESNALYHKAKSQCDLFNRTISYHELASLLNCCVTQGPKLGQFVRKKKTFALLSLPLRSGC